MNAGRVSALVMHGTNPAYHAADKEAFRTGLGKVKFSVSTSGMADETAARCTAMAPTITGWKTGWTSALEEHASIWRSPPFSPCSTPAQRESFMAWAGQPMAWYDVIRTTHNAGYTSDAMYSDGMEQLSCTTDST